MKVFKVKGDDGFTRISNRIFNLPFEQDWVESVEVEDL